MTWLLNGKSLNSADIYTLAKNDGLLTDDFVVWFPQNFNGQILCWNNEIEY